MLWIPFRLVYQHRRWQPERSTSAANDRPHPYHDRRHGWWTGLTLALLFNGLQPTPSGAAQTEIYRSTGESNEPLYTDTPASPDAREVELPPPSSVEMRPDVEAQRRLAVPASPDRGRERPSHTRSTSAHADFAIARPAPDAAVRSNQGQVQVVLHAAIAPDLL